MGTGDIGVPALRHLIDHPRHDLVGVFTQPDKPVGRKQVLTAPAVKTIATRAGVPLFQPENIRAPEALADLAALAPDLAIVMAYGQILPRSIIAAPRLACLNLHASILPKYRGAAPIQAAIREGDFETGITVIYIDEGLDCGDVLLTKRLALTPEETGQSLHDRRAALAPAVLEEACLAFERGSPPRTPQDHRGATHCSKLTREDGRLDWSRSAAALERTIRAYDPWPGATTTWTPPGAAPVTLKIFPPTAILPSPEIVSPHGLIVSIKDGTITVATGAGALRITELQPEGRRRMPAAEFLRGAALCPGDRFGRVVSETQGEARRE